LLARRKAIIFENKMKTNKTYNQHQHLLAVDEQESCGKDWQQNSDSGKLLASPHADKQPAPAFEKGQQQNQTFPKQRLQLQSPSTSSIAIAQLLRAKINEPSS
jgi:hypothetical protein